MSTAIEVDVAILGGGMVGASLAAGLIGSGTRVLLAEQVPFGDAAQPSFDERTTALGNLSRRIFEGMGVWPAIAPAAAPIRTIHVSEAGRFGSARLTAAEQGVDAFGFVVPNRVIGAALWERLRSAPPLNGAPQLHLHVPAHVADLAIGTDSVDFTVQAHGSAPVAVRARLVVGADGAHSQVRAAAGIEAQVEDYGQVAVVANVATDRPNDGTAYERFTPGGPLAVLPVRDGGYAVVWACAPALAAELVALEPAAYLARLQAAFGWRAGRFARCGVRASYPLRLARATAIAATRTVLIGNAAQALHPVAGQGFNLGLRDAALLAEVLANAGADPGAPEVLARYTAARAQDRSGIVRFTDGLVKLFASGRPGVGLLRNLGLLAFDVTPPAKRALARISLGMGGPTPRLARGLPVRRG